MTARPAQAASALAEVGSRWAAVLIVSVISVAVPSLQVQQ